MSSLYMLYENFLCLSAFSPSFLSIFLLQNFLKKECWMYLHLWSSTFHSTSGRLFIRIKFIRRITSPEGWISWLLTKFQRFWILVFTGPTVIHLLISPRKIFGNRGKDDIFREFWVDYLHVFFWTKPFCKKPRATETKV